MKMTVQYKSGKLTVGLLELANKLPFIGKKRMLAALEEARDVARTYPPELPNQRYRRTGRYYASFKITDDAGKGMRGARYILSSNAYQKGRYYTRYVGGLADGTGQAKIHQGRWAIIRDVVLEQLQKLVQGIEFDIRDALRNLGIGL